MFIIVKNQQPTADNSQELNRTAPIFTPALLFTPTDSDAFTNQA
jgi:hypothetical protein